MNKSILFQLPTLYILSNQKDNKKRFWKIWIIKKANKMFIMREYGVMNGKITKPEPKEIYNLNKGITEIKALWRKKMESGFDEEHKQTRKKTNVVRPMGALKLDEHSHKIKYPACVQTKLDGFRCLSHINDKEPIMYSKGMKPFVYLKHIKKEILKIKQLIGHSNIYLDGELYERNLKLHNISSLVMKKYATKEQEEEMTKISYYVFDMFNIDNLNETFKERYNNLTNIFKKYKFKYIKLVRCHIVDSFKEIEDLNQTFLLDGYEGVIVRNMEGLYKLNKKSSDVLRTKEFKKQKFIIIGARPGTGTQKGSIVWNLQCLYDKKQGFWAVSIGSIKDRISLYKDYCKNPKKYLGKYAIVKYIDMDKEGCICRNPIVESIL